MDAALGKLVVSLEANIAKFEQDLTRGENLAKAAMKSISDATSMAAGAAKSLGLAMAGIGSGLSVAVLVEKIGQAAERMADLQKASEKTGASVEGLSAIGTAAKLVGTDMNTVVAGLEKFDKSLASATDASTGAGKAIATLGLSAEKLRSMDTADAFKLVSDRLATYADSGGKTALVMELLGKRGAELIPVMKQLAENGELVAKVTSQQAAEAERYEQNMIRLTMAKDSLYKAMANALIPAMNAYLEDVLRIRQEHGPLIASFYALGGAIAMIFGYRYDTLDRLEEKIKSQFALVGRLREQLNNGSVAERTRPAIESELKFASAELRDLIARRDALQSEAAKRSKAAHPDGDLSGFTTGKPAADAPLDNLGGPIEKQRLLYERYADEAMRLGDKLAISWTSQANAATRALQIMPESERRVLDAFAAVDKQAEEHRLQLDKMYAERKITQDTYLDAIAKINEAQDHYKEIVRATADEQARLNGQWQYGASKALQTYIDQIQNVAAQTEQLMTKAFKGMEDALVKFVQTGKLDFKSLADSIIADMIRMQIQQSITGPLMKSLQSSGGFGGIFSAIGSLFGGGRAEGGPVSAGTTYLVGERGPELFKPNASGSILNSAQAAGVQVNVINNASGTQAVTRTRSEGGNKIIDVLVDQVRSAIAGDIARGNGAIPAALGNTYGLNRSAGAY